MDDELWKNLRCLFPSEEGIRRAERAQRCGLVCGVILSVAVIASVFLFV
jgi:hypothetical protein